MHAHRSRYSSATASRASRLCSLVSCASRVRYPAIASRRFCIALHQPTRQCDYGGGRNGSHCKSHQCLEVQLRSNVQPRSKACGSANTQLQGTIVDGSGTATQDLAPGLYLQALTTLSSMTLACMPSGRARSRLRTTPKLPAFNSVSTAAGCRWRGGTSGLSLYQLGTSPGAAGRHVSLDAQLWLHGFVWV